MISKSNCIKKTWSTADRIHGVYKATKPKGKKKQKNPYLQPNQSMKSKMDHEAQFNQWNLLTIFFSCLYHKSQPF